MEGKRAIRSNKNIDNPFEISAGPCLPFADERAFSPDFIKIAWKMNLKTLPYNIETRRRNTPEEHDTSDGFCLSCERDMKRQFKSLDEVD